MAAAGVTLSETPKQPTYLLQKIQEKSVDMPIDIGAL